MARTRRSSASSPTTTCKGPQDANYAINNLHPKAVLIIDDDEAYSQGLVNVMTPILKKAGITVNHQTLNGTDTGATLANEIKSLVTSQLTPNETVTFVPWQTATNAQQFGLTPSSRARRRSCSAPTAPTRRRSSRSRAATCRRSVLTSRTAQARSTSRSSTASRSTAPTAPSACRPRGDGRRDEGDRVGLQVGPDAEPLERLAAIKKTNIPAAQNPLGIPIAFDADGDLAGNYGYLFNINNSGTYVEIPPK